MTWCDGQRESESSSQAGHGYCLMGVKISGHLAVCVTGRDGTLHVRFREGHVFLNPFFNFSHPDDTCESSAGKNHVHSASSATSLL